MRAAVGSSTMELLLGDITQQDTGAIVNAANSALAGGGGVDGAIHRAAGPELAVASRALAPCPPGEARITPGFRLPARFVIHTVGPVYRGGAEGEAEVLSSAHRASLALADQHRVSSIAFPAISTGIYGYPVHEAARIALRAVAEHLAGDTGIVLVRFVLFDDATFAAFAAALRDLRAPA